MHIHHNICTFYWIERPPPKVIYHPNCECEREVPLMTKEVLHGIGLPLHVPHMYDSWSSYRFVWFPPQCMESGSLGLPLIHPLSIACRHQRDTETLQEAMILLWFFTYIYMHAKTSVYLAFNTIRFLCPSSKYNFAYTYIHICIYVLILYYGQYLCLYTCNLHWHLEFEAQHVKSCSKWVGMFNMGPMLSNKYICCLLMNIPLQCS